jgi:hypothetical protein
MGAFLVTLIIVSLLIIVGVVISVRFYARGGLGVGHFRRIRRVRTVTPTPAGNAVRETVEEIIDEEVPVEEEDV